MGRQRLRSLVSFFAVVAAIGFTGPLRARNVDDAVVQTAMAIPRVGMPGAPNIALPQPLSASDVARIRRIFALQRTGAVSAATQEIDGLESDILRGSILAERYLDTGYIPDGAEISAWLTRFGDQPDAAAIRALLRTLSGLAGVPAADPGPRHGNAGQKTALEGDARTLLVRNEDKRALIAAVVLLPGTPSPNAADALLSGGVAAWRMSDLVTARTLFEASWASSDNGSLRAAAAYWTARVHGRSHEFAERLFWLRRAAAETNTFYGIIARHSLKPFVGCLVPPRTKLVVSGADVESLLANPAGRRAFALLQVGERDRAEAEFRTLWFDAESSPILGRSLMLVAKAVGLNRLAEQLKSDAEAREASVGRFELPMLRPAGGFRMDPAFVYAVVRHESNFQPLAVSPVGARGLMQVMPGTAVDIGAIGDGQPDRLNDPSTNLAIGQRYLLQLANSTLVGDDLLRLIAAYGEGPTGMNRWADGVHYDHDPFVFLEAIPSAFMRRFIEDVLVYQWQYAAALRLRADSLDDLAAGIYPRFSSIKAVPNGSRARVAECLDNGLKG
jgi:soluble lytic murein transglycosylase-like protein